MKIIGVIPARYQSVRFPGKPLAEICGKPMIWWVYNQAKKVSAFHDVYVATEDKRIFDYCEQNEIQVLMTSDRHPTGTDRLSEVSEKISADFYVNIQGDEPLIEPSTIQKVIDFYLENPEISIINTMTKLTNKEDITNPSVVKVAAASSGRGLYLSRAAIPYSKTGAPVQHYKHLGLYGLTREMLQLFATMPRGYLEKIEEIEMMRFWEIGKSIHFIEVSSSSIAVDMPEDIDKVTIAMHNAKSQIKGDSNAEY